ncbi:MAG: type I restriction endonuclease subunit R [Rikenellaceae bacterium]
MGEESKIELGFINKLKDLNYIYRSDIRDRESLEQNFRSKFESLNRVKLTDSEYKRLLEEIVNPDVFISSKVLRERNTFSREDGTPLHYTLVDIKDWCKNDYEVVNQLRINTNNSHHRYDVIILINGIPVVQIELKGTTVNPRRAIQQIVDYKNDSGNGYTNTLLCFMQMFIVSNQTNTYYFTNNNNQHYAFNADEQFLPIYQYATKDNTKVTHLDTFSTLFLTKCTLGEMISNYMVLVATEQKTLVMRPYQVYAVKAIVDSINDNRGNGYIWHTTGSGKTLTSFKASTLLKDNPDVDKCLFVVDRKDLDKQTREEFNKFQENCVEENTNTETLVRRMLSDDYSDKVIVTTIQKLGIALDAEHKNRYKERLEPLRNQRIVFIFDECHRSQFGENHKAIKEFFPNSQLFGFTGTPIFEENATYKKINGEEASYKTTADVFENNLHNYTITHAIEDKNVLRFHVDYFSPNDSGDKRADGSIKKQAVVNAILAKHDGATSQRKFNAILATSSINEAIEYYNLFKHTQEKIKTEDESYEQLNITCVFSPPADGNNDIKQIQEDLPQERFDNEQEPDKKKKALSEIIYDYNVQYATNHTVSDFDVYYQDVQKRIKDQKYSNSDYPHSKKVDITIVVDMLLTGFDSKYLNTLYVDKNLKHHNLIQAFSRTNRVLNDTKPYGNILDFRGQEDAVNTAIALFSGEKADVAKEIWFVDPAPKVIEKFADAVSRLKGFMESYGLDATASEVFNLQGDEARAGFINCFKEVQRFRTQLDQYTDIKDSEKSIIEQLMPSSDLNSFRGAYIETAQRLRKMRDKKGDKSGASAQVEELDFEFVLFASAIIDYDYIMNLIANYAGGTTKQKVTKEQLVAIIGSTSNMMEDRELILEFIDNLGEIKGVADIDIKNKYNDFKNDRFGKYIAQIATSNNIEKTMLQSFVNDILDRMIFEGEKLNDLLESLDLGWKARTEKELALMVDLIPLLKLMANGKKISGLAAYEE